MAPEVEHFNLGNGSKLNNVVRWTSKSVLSTLAANIHCESDFNLNIKYSHAPVNMCGSVNQAINALAGKKKKKPNKFHLEI